MNPLAARLRVVVACGDGLYQRALCCRLAAEHDVLAVVLHTPRGARGSLSSRLRRYVDPVTALRYLHARFLNSRNDSAAQALIRRLFYVGAQEPTLSAGISVVRVEDVNVAETGALLKRLRPDVLCVNGTNLLREPILAIQPELRHGIVNLHTGLSPYSRGGNCNLFMLLEGRPEMVGATIHHIDQGIDSGDIILTGRPDLDVGDTYETIEAKVFHLGIELFLVALRQVAAGQALRVPQWEKGKVFLRRTGYVYDPTLRVRANRLIQRGLIRDYLAQRLERDAGVRLVGQT